MLKENERQLLGGSSSLLHNILSSDAAHKGEKLDSGSDNVICTSETLVPEGKSELSTPDLSQATRKQGIVLHPENEPVRVSDSRGDEGCEVVPELNKTVERISHFTPDEIEYFVNRATCLDKAGAALQNASYQAGEYAEEMFRAGYYVCLYAHDLFNIPEVKARSQRRAAKAMKELGY